MVCRCRDLVGDIDRGRMAVNADVALGANVYVVAVRLRGTVRVARHPVCVNAIAMATIASERRRVPGRRHDRCICCLVIRAAAQHGAFRMAINVRTGAVPPSWSVITGSGAAAVCSGGNRYIYCFVGMKRVVCRTCGISGWMTGRACEIIIARRAVCMFDMLACCACTGHVGVARGTADWPRRSPGLGLVRARACAVGALYCAVTVNAVAGAAGECSIGLQEACSLAVRCASIAIDRSCHIDIPVAMCRIGSVIYMADCTQEIQI